MCFPETAFDGARAGVERVLDEDGARVQAAQNRTAPEHPFEEWFAHLPCDDLHLLANMVSSL